MRDEPSVVDGLDRFDAVGAGIDQGEPAVVLEGRPDGLGPLRQLVDADGCSTHQLADRIVAEMLRRGDDLHAWRR